MITLYHVLPTDYMQAVKQLPVIKADYALHLRALVDVEKDETGRPRKAGDEWQLKGPITYIPQPEVVHTYIHRDTEVVCTYTYIQPELVCYYIPHPRVVGMYICT